MLSFTPMLKLEQVKEGGAAGGTPAKVEPNPPATPSPSDAPKGQEDLDDLGYEKVAEVKTEVKAGEETPKAPEVPKIDDKPIVPGTGYGKEAPKVDDLPPVVEPTKAEPDALDKALEGIPKEEIGKIKDFATKNKITVEQAKAFAELRKTEIKEAVAFGEKQKKDFENAKLRERAAWHKELKDDPTFGGEKFDKSLATVEKVMEEFLPQTKKMLTEGNGILPPYLMRDLSKLGEHLYATQKLVQGDAPTITPEKKDVDDALAFYE